MAVVRLDISRSDLGSFNVPSNMNIVEGSYNVYDANGQLHQEQAPPPKGKIKSSFMPNVRGVRWTDSVFTAVGGNYTGPRALSGTTLSRQTQSGLSVQHSASYPGPNAYQPNGQQTGSMAMRTHPSVAFLSAALTTSPSASAQTSPQLRRAL